MGPGEFGQEFGGGRGCQWGKGEVGSDQGYVEIALKSSCSSTIISLSIPPRPPLFICPLIQLPTKKN